MTAVAFVPQAAGVQRRRWPLPVRVLVLALAFFLLPNLAILGLHWRASRAIPKAGLDLPVKNFTAVDDKVWRGAAPGDTGYAALAEHGVTTVVDLRAEDNIEVDDAMLRRLGIRRIPLPMRDGQSPSSDLVARFLQVVEASPGRVFVHCGAGVGRTGTMAAAYLVASGQATPREALQRNLSVGPPSLEQIAFSAGLGGDVRRPNPVTVAVSRALDAPRRIWVTLHN